MMDDSTDPEKQVTDFFNQDLDWWKFATNVNIPSPTKRYMPASENLPKHTGTSMNEVNPLQIIYHSIQERLRNINYRLDTIENSINHLQSNRSNQTALNPARLKWDTLNKYCQPVFRHTYRLSPIELNGILSSIDRDIPENDRRRTQSQVRLWFRKKRDEQTQKLLNTFREQYQTELRTERGKHVLLKRLESGSLNLAAMTRMAKLEFEGETSINFARDKVISFLQKQLE